VPSRPTFSHERRETILAGLRAGSSLREAARGADVSHVAVLKWIERGRISEPGGTYHNFFADVWELQHPGAGDAPVVPIGTGRRLDPELKRGIDAWFAERFNAIAAQTGQTVEELAASAGLTPREIAAVVNTAKTAR
jgi:hypothetical protein